MVCTRTVLMLAAILYVTITHSTAEKKSDSKHHVTEQPEDTTKSDIDDKRSDSDKQTDSDEVRKLSEGNTKDNKDDVERNAKDSGQQHDNDGIKEKEQNGAVLRNLKKIVKVMQGKKLKRKHKKRKHRKRIYYTYAKHMASIKDEMRDLANIAIEGLKIRKKLEKERRKKIAKWKKKLHDMKGHKKTIIPDVPIIERIEDKPAVTKAAVPVAKPLCEDICQHRCLQSCHIACCVPDLTPTMRDVIARRMETSEPKKKQHKKKCPKRCKKTCDPSCDFACCLPEKKKRKHKKI